MNIAVVKFGGSSLSNSKKILYVANRISELLKDYKKLVVVLSAPADVTDNLISLSKNISERNPTPNILQTGELLSIALMEIALKSIGIKAIALNHYQLFIKAKTNNNNTEIISLNTKKLKNAFLKHNVIIIPGFIACNESMETVILGRGGSDYTAVFIAKILKSPCFLFSDVKGIYSSNPSYMEDARKIDYISYDELINIIKYAAQVRHSRAIEFATKNKIELHLGSTFHPDEKTTKIISDKSDRRIKYIDIKTDLNQTTVYLIGNYIEKRIDIFKKIYDFFPNAKINSSMKDVIEVKLKESISMNDFKKIHNYFVFR